jgi:hypothetical protein
MEEDLIIIDTNILSKYGAKIGLALFSHHIEKIQVHRCPVVKIKY